MVWIIIIAICVTAGAFSYFGRYKSQKLILGFDTVQFIYLFITTPLIFLGLINLGLEVAERPEEIIFPFSTNLLLALYLLTVYIGIMGVAVHSTATTVSDYFVKKDKSKAHLVDEFLHGPLSHEMLYLGAMTSTLFLSLLEMNHPDLKASFNWTVAFFLGATLGIAWALGINWSRYVKYNLAASFTFLCLIFLLTLPRLKEISYYPITSFMLACLSALSFGLILILMNTEVKNKSFSKSNA